jgi:FSR family fosmidomycin resistance protein-like MFS transporter
LHSNPIRNVFPIAVAHLSIELSSNFLPVVYPILITSMGLSYAQVGLVALVANSAAALAQPLFGYLSDRWVPRPIIISSIIWIGLLMGLVGLIHVYWLLVLLVGLGSLGSAAFHPAGAAAAGSIVTNRRGTTLSIFSVSGAVGTAMSPLLVTAGIKRLGLPGTMLIVPIGLLVGILLYLQPGWGRDTTPSSAPSQPKRSEGQAPAQKGSALGLALVVLIVMCRSWFQYSLVTYLPEWLRGQGEALLGSGHMLTALLISISVGTLMGGILSDRIGRWQVVALSLGLLGPAHWLFVMSGSASRLGLAILVGILIGASFPVTVAMAHETWPRGVGLASALVTGLGWLPGGIGASFTGYVADQSSLATGMGYLLVAPALGLVCALAYALVWTRQRTQ